MDLKLSKKNILYDFNQNYISNPTDSAFLIQKKTKDNDITLFSKVSYANLFDDMILYSSGLEKYALRGKRIVILHPPNKEIISLIYSMFLIGAIPVFIDPNVGVDHLKICIKNSKAEAILSKSLLMPIVKYLTRSSSISIFLSPLGVKRKGNKEKATSTYNDEHFSSNNTAGIFYTSGTTGVPKGAVWSHKNIKGQINLLEEIIGSNKNISNLALFPLFLIYGPLFGHTTVWLKLNVTKPISIDSKRIIDFLKCNKIDYTFGSPIIWKKLLSYCESNNEVIPNVNCILSGGAPISEKIAQELNKKMVTGNFYVTYGATEALPITYSSKNNKKSNGTLLGKVFNGVNVKIEHTPKTNKNIPLCSFELGEIVVQGEQVTSGYIHNNIKSNDNHEGSHIHNTGDYGYFDNNNDLWYYGRKKHAIIDHNVTYYPVPIEKQINQIIKQVCTIYALDQKLYLILEKKSFSSFKLSKNELIDKVNLNIYKKEFYFDDLLCFPKKFPVDKRHYSKLDRTKIQNWALSQIK